MEHAPDRPEPQNSNAGNSPGTLQSTPQVAVNQRTSTKADAAVDTAVVVDVASAANVSAPPIAAVVSVDQVKLGLRRVKDPDLQINIMDLGLVYGVRVDGAVVSVDMTLTSPGCPSGPEIMSDAERQLRTLPGVEDVKVNLIWAPFWSPDKIEPRVRAYLGI